MKSYAVIPRSEFRWGILDAKHRLFAHFATKRAAQSTLGDYRRGAGARRAFSGWYIQRIKIGWAETWFRGRARRSRS